MLQPGTFDSETVRQIRHIVGTTYAGRDDLYAAADQLQDGDLAVICRNLADDLAGKSVYLTQLIAINGDDPTAEHKVASALTDEIMRFLRNERGDAGIVAAVKESQQRLREDYDQTIAAMRHPEAHAVVEEQKRGVEFAERVLRKVAPQEGEARPAVGNEPAAAPDPPGSR
jgi:uncharacterized protein (TIGR02284 family)